MHCVRDLLPPLDLFLVPDARCVWEGGCCAGGDCACFADNQGSWVNGALRVVGDCHGKLDVVRVGAKAGEGGHYYAVGGADMARCERGECFSHSGGFVIW